MKQLTLARWTILLSYLLISTVICHKASGQRVVTEEAKIFQELRDGVFTVFGDQGHGTGFLIDESGVILTNQHVIAGSSQIRVLINDSTKVESVLLYADDKNDLAAILVNPKIVVGLPVLTIRFDTSNYVIEGERVIAIGSPLNQTRILTSGIVSKVEKTVVISDVNINPGNSGGPLINMDREVIAVNTFSDFTKQGGPGVSGSIRMDQFLSTVYRVLDIADTVEAPSSAHLPTMPQDIFPLWALEDAALNGSYPTKRYAMRVGNFDVQFQTPPYLYAAEKEREIRLASKRSKRVEKGTPSEQSSYDPFQDLKSWYQYVGNYAPVVMITVLPRTGQTSGSTWGNILGAFASGMSGSNTYYGSYEYEFKADLQDFDILLNGSELDEIERGLIYVPIDFYTATYGGSYSGEDLARAGVFIFSSDIFTDDWPLLTIQATSVEKPKAPILETIHRRLMEQIWIDFEPYREQQEAKDIERVPGGIGNISPTGGTK